MRNLRGWDYLVGVHDESRMGALRLVDPESGRHVDDRELSAPPVTELPRLEVEEVRASVRGWEKRARAMGALPGEIALMQAVIDPGR